MSFVTKVVDPSRGWINRSYLCSILTTISWSDGNLSFFQANRRVRKTNMFVVQSIPMSSHSYGTIISVHDSVPKKATQNCTYCVHSSQKYLCTSSTHDPNICTSLLCLYFVRRGISNLMLPYLRVQCHIRQTYTGT